MPHPFEDCRRKTPQTGDAGMGNKPVVESLPIGQEFNIAEETQLNARPGRASNFSTMVGADLPARWIQGHHKVIRQSALQWKHFSQSKVIEVLKWIGNQ